MYLPPLHPQPHRDIYVSGDVTIHPSAAIAPGVLIQAEAESRVVIGSGVCIGMGSVIHAHDGLLEVQSGAVLGAGVLLMGTSQVGAGASIGASSTILDSTIAAQTIVQPGSLIGDRSRQEAVEELPTTDPQPEDPESISDNGFSHNGDGTIPESNSEATPEAVPATEADTSQNGSGNLARKTVTHVYGQAYVSELLSTLLPHRQTP
jgi:carbon dioxide concentrating mechanism protein CcmN